MDYKIIGKNGAHIFYKTKSAGAVTAGALGSLPWPSDVSKLSLLFEDPVDDTLDLPALTIPEKFSARIVCYVDRKDISIPAIPSDTEDITSRPPRDISEIRELYLASVKRVFEEEWQGRLPEDRLKFSEKVAREHLSPTKSLCLMRGNTLVGLATFVSINDFIRGPVDCFNWVWLDKSLAVPGRISAQFQIVTWLKESVGEHLVCYIDLFNRRSLRFARRIGFKPVCLNLERL